MKKAVLALSGGMDSTTVLEWLLNHKYKVRCVIFSYGAKHNKWENAAAWEVYKHYKNRGKSISATQMYLEGVFASSSSNLMSTGGEIPEGHYTDESMKSTVVPGRNIIFLSILASIAGNIGAEVIAIGIHQGDHAIYADCRTEFYKAMDTAIYLGMDKKVSILAPFCDTDKTGILEYGLMNDVHYGITRTCYKQQEIACGKCGSCVERIEAWKSQGLVDPIPYETGE